MMRNGVDLQAVTNTCAIDSKHKQAGHYPHPPSLSRRARESPFSRREKGRG
jgi:hypothetical protein